MKNKHPYGFKIWSVVPCAGGFGEYESNGPLFVRKASIRTNPKLDGLIHRQTGPAVIAETLDGMEVTGMLISKS